MAEVKRSTKERSRQRSIQAEEEVRQKIAPLASVLDLKFLRHSRFGHLLRYVDLYYGSDPDYDTDDLSSDKRLSIELAYELRHAYELLLNAKATNRQNEDGNRG